MQKLELIGIGGTLGAGKDFLSEILVGEYGYAHVSTGDAVRAEAQRRFGNADRATLRRVANEMRNVHGAGALCLGAMGVHKESAVRESGLAISGLRAAGEAEVIRSAGGLLLFVDAPIELRYDRLVDRNRLGDTVSSLEELRDFEQSEMTTASATGQNIQAVRDMSHTVIWNDQGEDHLRTLLANAMTTFSEQ